ncbi:MAG: hypothetical protein ACE5JG_11695, partial [Planctomycetota bacterium]
RALLPDLFLVVDHVCGVVCEPAPDADVVIGSAGKGLMSPPGLAFLCLGERALERLPAQPPASVLDLRGELAAQRRGGTRFTPPVTLVRGLAAALRHVAERGADRLAAESRRRAASFREGLPVLAERPAAAMTAVPVEDAEAVRARLREAGVEVAGGQEGLRGRILRVAHFPHLPDAAQQAVRRELLK